MSLTRDQLATRLREARLVLGLTQAEVGEKLDVRRPTISAIETGRRAVTSEELYQFSQIYGVPVWSLLRQSPLEEVEKVLFRAGVVDEPAARLAIRRFVERCQTEQELEELLGISRYPERRPTYRMREPKSVWDAVQQGEDLAERERNRLGLEIEPLRNPLELLARQGVRIGPLEGLGQEDLDGVFFQTDELGACVGVNTECDVWTGFRITFTVAHEYAPWLLRDTEAEPYDRRRFKKDLKEVRANAFAAAFLMPREGVIRYFSTAGLLGQDGRIADLTPADIVRAMDHFGVSRPALLYRLKGLRLISDELSQELRSATFSVTAVADALGLHLREEYNLDAYLNELIIRAWQRGLITTGRAADLLGIEDIADFRRRMAEIGAEIEVDDSELLGAADRKVVPGHIQQG